MSTISKILLPVDFSPKEIGPARYAAALAQHYKAELTLLHVILPFPWAPPPGLDDSRALQLELTLELEERRRRQLDAYGRNDLRDLRVSRVLASGDPAELIIEQIERDKTDLVVMPTSGCGPFRRFLLGSVTGKVLHDTTCPVWTSVHMEKPMEEKWKGIRNILCALDTGPRSSQILKWAGDLAKEFEARLSIVHAIPSDTPLTHRVFDPGLWEVLEAEARDQMAEVKLEAGDHHSHVLIEEGNPSKEVSKVAQQTNADLLVIGRNPMAGVFGRLQEHSYSIIRDSPCPVVSM